MQLVQFLVAALCFVQVSSECDKKCRDFYYNCRALEGVPTDKPWEVVNCEEDTYKLRCPELCNECTDCDFVTTEELEKKLSGLEDTISDLEKRLKDQFEEKLEDVVGNLSDAASASTTAPKAAGGMKTYKEDQLRLMYVSSLCRVYLFISYRRALRWCARDRFLQSGPKQVRQILLHQRQHTLHTQTGPAGRQNQS